MNTKLTPVMEQYLSIKEQYKECLLFYRMGDFYELFFEDAIQAAKTLNIVLTHRGQQNGENIPMCGVPSHSSITYLNKLIENGFKVAICEQLETPAQAKARGGYKTVIKREVVQVITPGTIIEDDLLNSSSANYILAIAEEKNKVALAWLDLSTSKFFYCLTYNLSSDITRIEPKEILISEVLFEKNTEIQNLVTENRIFVTKHTDSFFNTQKGEKKIQKFYQTSFSDSIGELSNAEVAAIGAVLEYLCRTQKESELKIGYPKLYNHKYFLQIDAAARKSLELTSVIQGSYKGSLADTIDYTITSTGSRLLKSYIASPIVDSNIINKRLDLVESYTKRQELKDKIREILKKFPDLERSLSRIALKKASPKDLYAIKNSLDVATQLSYILFSSQSKEYKNLEGYEELLETLTAALKPNYSRNNVKNGGFINANFSPKLAQLEYIKSNSAKLILELQEFYKQKTGVNTLKISSNNLIGYYIEIPVRHQIEDKEFIHKQSLASCVRYTTAHLQELEISIVTTNANAVNLEQEIFDDLCDKVVKQFTEISLTAQTIAKLDVITSLAEVAIQNNYVRPLIDNSYEFVIEKGRHPIVERAVDNFTANDINLNHEKRIYLLTGPNMAGKSTFLRQNALIAILAHIGSFIPAQSAHIGIIDKIFSRVGAADNLLKGQSTFMVEMIETAAIINQATERSLCCYSMKVHEWQQEIIFLHEVIEGPSNRSYGIHVAKLAGLPNTLITRAESILEDLNN